MSYFSYFPHIQYSNFLIRDITSRIAKDLKLSNSFLLFKDYIIKDNERLDTLANSVYGHPKYSWIILICNNLTPKDWPFSVDQFEEFVKEKYGDTLYKIKYYKDTNGNIIQKIQAKEFVLSSGEVIEFYNDGSGFGALNNNLLNGTTLTPVTNYQYEFDLNESKRKIKLLQKEYLSSFVNDFESLAGNGRI